MSDLLVVVGKDKKKINVDFDEKDFSDKTHENGDSV